MKSLLCVLACLVLVSGVIAQDPTPSPDFDCPDRDDHIYPDPNDCSKYFICTNGLAWHEKCPDGTLFDPNLLFCTWPWEVDCKGSGSTAPPVTTTTTVAPTVGSSSPAPATSDVTMTPSSDNPSTMAPSTDGNTATAPPSPTTGNPPTTPDTGDFTCPNNEYHSYPHPTDCDKYYVCNESVPFLEFCPDGLWFDPILELCNWPDVVDCTPKKMNKKRKMRQSRKYHPST